MVKSNSEAPANDFATAAFSVKLLKSVAATRLSNCLSIGEQRTGFSARSKELIGPQIFFRRCFSYLTRTCIILKTRCSGTQSLSVQKVARLLHFNSLPIHLFHTALILSISSGVSRLCEWVAVLPFGSL